MFRIKCPLLIFAIMISGCEGLVSPLGVAEGGIVYGKVTDEFGRPKSEVKVFLRKISEHFGEDPSAPGVIGAQSSLLIEIHLPVKVNKDGTYKVPEKRSAPGWGLQGTWEIGCGEPHEFIAKDTVVLKPYVVVRKDIQC